MRNKEAIPKSYSCSMMTQNFVPSVTQLLQILRGLLGNTTMTLEQLLLVSNLNASGFPSLRDLVTKYKIISETANLQHVRNEVRADVIAGHGIAQ